ncbi:hypothetical protein [Azospirillum doebereinerae]
MGRDVDVAVRIGGSGTGRVGQNVVDARRRPRTATGSGKPWPGIQPFEDLADGHLFFGQPAEEEADQIGLGFINDQMAEHALLPTDVAVTVGCPTGKHLPRSGLLQFATTKAFRQHRPFIFGDGALDLEQELIVRVFGDGMVQEHHRASGAAEFLEKQNLVGILAGQPIRAEHGNDANHPIAHHVAQAIKTRPIETRAAESLVAKHMIFDHVIAVGDRPGAQGVSLTVDGLVAALAVGGDAGVEGGMHGATSFAGARGQSGRLAAIGARSSKRWR